MSSTSLVRPTLRTRHTSSRVLTSVISNVNPISNNRRSSSVCRTEYIVATPNLKQRYFFTESLQIPLIRNDSINARYYNTQAKPIKMFKKILIANRGEIACRVIRTCKKLGISTVAVYSIPDSQSVHVKMADESICIGPAASSQSYLSIPKIIDAVKRSGAEAVHPGYGFLSENRLFQEALEKIGVKFIGPGTDAIQAMGDKISSKKIAKKAGVNIIPGYLGAINNDKDLLRIANEIGYPVMIKASAGGGGKGMRIAYSDEEAVDGFRLSQAEAKSSFGDETMFVEKYIEEPRHIEIQLLVDSYGNALYLNERECTIQRRNQKVIEEAPSTFLDTKTRAAMGEQAVALAKAVGYESAGTCEFLVDKHKQFYFLEMNTRLQVEHPVTEMITQLDLVELMIRIAAGEKLFPQSDVKLIGWAFEARVYAEDPLRGFLPSIGKLIKYKEPTGPNVRVDSGVREGSEISIHYDPMISKLITYGASRDEALQHMREALDSYIIRGVTHNINFLRSLCDHPRYMSGNITTKFIQEEYPKGYMGAVLSNDQKSILLAAAVSLYVRTQTNAFTIHEANNHKINQNRRKGNSLPVISDLYLTLDNVTYQVNSSAYIFEDTPSMRSSIQSDITITIVKSLSEKNSSSTSDTVLYMMNSDYEAGDLLFNVQLTEGIRESIDIVNMKPNGKTFNASLQVSNVSESTPTLSLIMSGTAHTLSIYTPTQYKLLPYMPPVQHIDTSKSIISPMPGAVYSLKVNEGETVVAGQEVCVIEAMKMQNALRAVTNGKVKKVHVKQGQTVAADQILVELE